MGIPVEDVARAHRHLGYVSGDVALWPQLTPPTWSSLSSARRGGQSGALERGKPTEWVNERTAAPALAVLLAHGSADHDVSPWFSQTFSAEDLKVAGHRVQLSIVSGASHGTIYTEGDREHRHRLARHAELRRRDGRGSGQAVLDGGSGASSSSLAINCLIS
jgi:hypothetical protein